MNMNKKELEAFAKEAAKGIKTLVVSYRASGRVAVTPVRCYLPHRLPRLYRGEVPKITHHQQIYLLPWDNTKVTKN
ncbi:hypothetical protein I633_14590 [Alteromonas mediterranea 615]|uniref:Uncharacterized protein n=1 Tax=Alteromonas mediterranea 615 TaxID=1300253 RepID=S5AIN8_9ALTE|nr:hypothetical protein I633_14590 [Alteromonas mediterranea 615]